MRLSRDNCRSDRRQRWEALERRVLFSAAFDVTALSQLRADPAFAGIDGSDLSVAVLDTGLFASHPDIAGNFLRFFDAVGNGQNADSDPGTAVASQAFDPPGEGHGTHVAGTVGSTNPEVGVATGTNLIGVRALASEGDSQPQVNPLVAGLQWVLTNQDDYNIRVVNMSLGSNTNFNSVPNKDDVGRLIDQLESRGVTVVSASGNSYGGFASAGTAYPSVFSTIAVANTWEDAGTAAEREQVTLGQGNGGLFGVIDSSPEADQLSASSQRSTLGNQVAAPGTTIFSTWNGDGGLLYNTIAGTSMASPFVAGSVALMQDAALTFGGRYLSPVEVLAIIRETADDVVDAQNPDTARFRVGRNAAGQLVQTGPVQDLPESGQTYQRINVYRAVQRVRDFITGGTDPTPDPDPGGRTDDTNNVIAAATAIPSLTGLDQFQFAGRVGADGNVNVGATDVDLYRVVLASPGFPVFDLDAVAGGQSFDPVVRLFDAAGNEIAAEDDTAGDEYPTLNTATRLSTPLAPGTYFLGVGAFGNTAYNPADGAGATAGGSQGDYNVTVALSNPDPNGVFQGAFTIDLTNPDVVRSGTAIAANFIPGSIGSDPNPVTPDGTPRIDVGAEDVDFFQVIAPDTGRLTIDVDALSVNLPDAVDSFLAVYDASLNLVDVNDDENPTAGLFDSLLTVNVTGAATYFVAITTFQNRDFSPSNPFDRASTNANARGSYEAYFSFDNGDANGTVNTAARFADADPDGDGRVVGVIGADLGVPLLSVTANGGAKDVDFFAVTPTQPGLLEVDVTGDAGFDGVIGLWATDEEGLLVALGDTDDSPSSIGVEITGAMVDNDLFVSVTGAGNQGFNPFAVGSGNGGETGSYTLAVVQRSEQEFRARTNNSVNNHTPEPIVAGESVRSDVGRDGDIDVGGDDVDVYRYVATVDGTLTVRTDTSTEASADTFLRVFDADGEEIAFNNNASDATTASMVTVTVLAGRTYYIGVNGAGENARAYDPLTGAGAAEGSEGEYGLLLEASASDTPIVTISNVSVTEVVGGTSQAVFVLTLTRPATVASAVNLATENRTAAAGSDYAATSVTVPFPAGTTEAAVAVNVIGDFDEEAAETFAARLTGATGVLIGDLLGVATIVNTTAPPPTPFNASQPITFTRAGGGLVTLSLKGPGTGSAFFAPGGAEPGRIVLDGTTGATTLTIRGDAALPDLLVNGSLKALGSKTTDLAGDLTVTGSVPKLTFDDVTDATITIAAGAPVTIAADLVRGLFINSAAPIKSMKVSDWSVSDNVDNVLTTPGLLSLAVRGQLNASIRAGVVGKVSVGSSFDGELRAEQSIASVTTRGVLAARVFAGVAPAVATLPDAADDFINPAARIGSVTAQGRGVPAAFAGIVAAPVVGKLKFGPVAGATAFGNPGVAADVIQSLSAVVDAQPLRLSRLDDPSTSRTVGPFMLVLL